MTYTKINEVLDHEHSQIFKSLIRVYGICDRAEIDSKQDYKAFKKMVLKAVENAYVMAKKHWITEERYFKDGTRLQPHNHKDTYEEIEEHRREHTKNLQFLESFYNTINDVEAHSDRDAYNEINYIKRTVMKIIQNIENHIDTMDDPHFSHWVKSTGYL